MSMVVLVLAVITLAYANGANDNFKGVATLYGSGTLSFRRAVALATVATVLGSAVSIVLAQELVRSFSGEGLVPDELTFVHSLLIAVAGGGAVAVLLATRLGLPTSTTHALTGALLGVSVVHHGDLQAGETLWRSFLAPLLLSPLIAVVAAGVFAYVATRGPRRGASAANSCLCVGESALARVVCVAPGATWRLAPDRALTVMVGSEAECARLPAMVRLRARRVAETMSRRITPLDPGRGAIGNLVTAGIVLGASRFGMPVSTTHVSVGSIMGVGATSRRLDGGVVLQILLAWIATLPLGALVGAVLFAGLR